MRIQYAAPVLIFTILTIVTVNAQKIGLQTSAPQHNVHITQPANTILGNNESVLHTEYTGTNVANVIGIRAKSKPADGLGIGGYFDGGLVGVVGIATGTGSHDYTGVRGLASTAAVGGAGAGLVGECYGSGTNYGLYASADDGTTNWAGYFEQGNVFIANRLGFGQLNPLFTIDMLKSQAVVRMVSHTNVNGSVLELRNTTASPTFFGALNFGTDVTTPGQIGYLGTHHMAFRVANLERMRIGQNHIGMFNSSPQHPIHINQPSGVILTANQPVLHVEYTGTNNADMIGIRGVCKPLDYYGVGGEFEGGFVGVRGKVNGSAALQYYAVRGEATGTAGTKYGIYGTASGGGTNWAGYFAGRVHIEARLGIARDPVTNEFELEGNASKTFPGDWVANSDARLKKNIESLDPAQTIHQLLSLQGVTYEWNDDKTGSKRPEGTQYGFTAQNIREVFPEFVQEDALGYLQTAYGTYDAMMVEAIRYLYSENQMLKNELAEIKNAIGR